MASTEHLLISKVVQTGSVQEVTNAGLRPYHFDSKFAEVYSWILDYWREYSATRHHGWSSNSSVT